MEDLDMEHKIIYIIAIIAVIICLIFFVVRIIKLCRLSKEERQKVLKTYLKGLVALAEQEIVGNKRGQERLEMVEESFRKKAPLVYKIILLLLGKDNLTQLIEDALKEIKDVFEK